MEKLQNRELIEKMRKKQKRVVTLFLAANISIFAYANSIESMYSKCINEHNVEQCYKLGLAYINGEGIAKNKKEGKRYLLIACEKGKIQKACDMLNGKVAKNNHKNYESDYIASGEYYNDKFGFLLRYPGKYFTRKRMPDAGDGVILSNATSGLEVRAYGGWTDRNLNGLYREMRAYVRNDGGRITYHVRKRSWFVLSGYREDGKIFYQKTILHRGKSATLLISYPVKYKRRYDRLVNALVHGFSFWTP